MERVLLLFTYHFPFIEKENLNKKFDNFPWTNNLEYLRLGKRFTGYPIIDAGMRELWETGYMHNRVSKDRRIFLS